MDKRISATAFLAALAVVATSCRRASPPDFERAVATARHAATEGRVDEAVATLDGMLRARSYRDFRPQLQHAMLDLLLEAGRIEAAQARFRGVAESDPAFAATMIGKIEQWLADRGKHDALAAWCGSLSRYRFAEAALGSVATWHLRALEFGGRGEAALPLFKSYAGRLSPSAGRTVASDLVHTLISRQAYERAERALAFIKATLPDDAEQRAFLLNLRLDLLLAQAQWEPAAAAWREAVSDLDDGTGAGILRRFGMRAIQGGQRAVIDGLCEQVLRSDASTPPHRTAAAELWVRSAQSAADVTLAIRRLGELPGLGFDAPQVLSLVENTYTELLAAAQRSDAAALLALCDALRSGIRTEEAAASLAGIMLDVSFCAGDFQAAARVVDAGVPGHDRKWHDMMGAKVHAHLALQQGNPREAVAQFRRFMECIAGEARDQFDPVTGSRVTRDMILGLNARRIGDILKAANDPAGARKAYAEARAYYEQAKAGLAEGSEEHRQIESDLAKLPPEA